MRAPHELHLSAARVTMHAYHSLSATTASIFTSKHYLCTFMNVITRWSFGLLLLLPPLLMQKSALRPMPVAPHRMCSAAVHLQRQTSMPYAPEQAAPELPKQCITLHCPPDSAHVVHEYLRLLSASHPRLIHHHHAARVYHACHILQGARIISTWQHANLRNCLSSPRLRISAAAPRHPTVLLFPALLCSIACTTHTWSAGLAATTSSVGQP